MLREKKHPAGSVHTMASEPHATRSPWAGRIALLSLLATVAVFCVMDETLVASLLAGQGSRSVRLTEEHAALPQPWRGYYQGVAQLRGPGGEAPYETLSALLTSWRFTMQPDDLRRGVAYTGVAQRLRRLHMQLAEGRRPTLRVAVVGGSISWGSAVKRGEEDWFSRVTVWLQQSYPGVNITAKNGCVPATPSAFMELCLQNHMGDDADLVFMEYATNDGKNFTLPEGRKTFERLVRKVLGLPSRPAVVIVHLPTKGQAYEPERPDKAQFYDTVEDVYGAFSAYYQVPALSLRDMVWPMAELHERGGNWSDWYGHHDFVHPVEPGHKAIADLVVWQWQRMAIALALEPPSREELREADGQLPQPMYPGNYEGATRVCLHGMEFQKIVASSKGWDLINEGDEIKQKWGYVATKPGPKLTFVVNTTRETAPELPTMTLMLAYLKSYAHMGTAEVTCGGGCECRPSKVDAAMSERVSTIFLHAIQPTQAPRCQITVTNLDKSSSGEHKFKVTGVMASESSARPITYLTKEDFMGHVNHGASKPYEKKRAAEKAAAAGGSKQAAEGGEEGERRRRSLAGAAPRPLLAGGH